MSDPPAGPRTCKGGTPWSPRGERTTESPSGDGLRGPAGIWGDFLGFWGVGAHTDPPLFLFQDPSPAPSGVLIWGTPSPGVKFWGFWSQSVNPEKIPGKSLLGGAIVHWGGGPWAGTPIGVTPAGTIWGKFGAFAVVLGCGGPPGVMTS